jgi:hypothetical protein
MVEKVHNLTLIAQVFVLKLEKKKNQWKLKKKTFILTKHFFLFSFIWTPLTFKVHNFLIFSSFQMI